MGQWQRRCHFGTMLFFDAFGLCMVLPIAADLAKEFFGTRAALALSLSAGMKAFFTLLCGPVVGVLSDKFGRWPFLLTAHLLLLASLFCGFLTALTGHIIPMYCYLVLDAITGTAPLLVLFLTIVADDVSPDNRAPAFGLVLAVFDVAFMLAPSLGGALSLSAGFATAVGAVFLGLLLSLCFPETKPECSPAEEWTPEEALVATPSILRRSSLPWSRQNDNRTGGFESRMLRPDLAMRILLSNSYFRSLSLCILCSTMVIGGIQGTFVLFIEAQLQFTRQGAALLLSLLAFSGLLVQACLLKPMVRCFGLKYTLIVGLCFQTVENLLFVVAGLVPKGESANPHWSLPILILACGCIVGGFGTVTFPAISALKANACSAEEQGRIQGAISALQAFGMGVGPMAYGGLFSVFSNPQPMLGLNRALYPACYVLSLILLPAAVIVTSTLKVPVPQAEQHVLGTPDTKQTISLQNVS